MTFKKYQRAEPIAIEHAPDLTCGANGCFLRASVSMGGPWNCIYHATAEASTWPLVTDGIRESKHIFYVLDDLLKMPLCDWDGAKNQRALFAQLFDDEPTLKPAQDEGIKKYEMRLRNEVARRCGLIGKRTSAAPVRAQPETWQSAGSMDFDEIF